ncbi:MAG: hypothetical protein C4560_04370 [Nitrospiraceae bacterium]|nr:MAG: hypothetical protein C4560_04370 [Nitrospiraceae bacterium]
MTPPINSGPGRGSTFKIYLPIIKADLTEIHPEELPEPAGAPPTILLSEDDPADKTDSRRALKKALGK